MYLPRTERSKSFLASPAALVTTQVYCPSFDTVVCVKRSVLPPENEKNVELLKFYSNQPAPKLLAPISYVLLKFTGVLSSF